jgi:hypothetical protein
MSNSTPSEELEHIIASAKRLGVNIDEEAALQWLTAIAAAGSSEDVVLDTRSGVFGHKISMLDFSPEDLAHFQEFEWFSFIVRNGRAFLYPL